MDRRKFFKVGAVGIAGSSLVPVLSHAAKNRESMADRSKDQWLHLGKGKQDIPQRIKTPKYNVAVIGGGVAGICAAVSSARNGAKTVLVQDRSVLGGNASSEVRVHLNGVNHLKNGLAERETGVIEEILLHNRFHNPQESYPYWDHLLYDFVTREPNLELLVNTSAIEAIMKGGKISAARCWQGPSETEYIIYADYFIDCSGDGLLAATSGASYRTGREGKAEFNEKYAPEKSDGWQMGASLLFFSKNMGKPMPYEAPHYALPFDLKKSHPGRKIRTVELGYWWIEVGSDDDIVADFDENRHKLMGYVHGIWDYVKNSGDYPEAENYALDWVGSFPGRRESRRFMGDYIVSETDMTEHKHFRDAVAFGGWSLDEHNPGGIENLSEPPSYFHEHFSRIYEYPFRSLYSKDVSNLLFAGRNVSQTHIALSSSRIMATCALMGQAVGTAAALCFEKGLSPRVLGEAHIDDLQEQLLRDDVFIPHRAAKDPKDLAKKTSVIFASSTKSGDAGLLIDGMSRDFEGAVHHWCSKGLPADVQMEWDIPVSLSKVEVKCDTNVTRNIMMRHDSRNDKAFTNTIPEELLKSLVLEARVRGVWKKLGAIDKNRTRLIKFSFEKIKTSAIRIRLLETYGKEDGKLFEVRAYA